ncbi:unnamed protein product [Lupinus luteus]|uniref:Uncharacterized protein n=1 Tax=Lupinus luteus TaxID=3873 RepID=A0AAV1X719_LUPLU
MIMKCVRSISMAMPALPIPQRPIITCCSLSPPSTFNTQHLRSQLDLLHSEAHHTTTKANSARLRLLRLSEAADKLQKQAAIRIQKGEENDAREMLYQRKKVLQALENTKSRIELLDELSIKLSENQKYQGVKFEDVIIFVLFTSSSVARSSSLGQNVLRTKNSLLKFLVLVTCIAKFSDLQSMPFL